jgi:virginiamycin B lyase
MDRRSFLALGAGPTLALAAPATIGRAQAPATPSGFRVRDYPVAERMGSRDVTAAKDGTMWFGGHRNGTLGRLDPDSGALKLIGSGATPHGIGRVTEGGQNAIDRVDLATEALRVFRLPADRGNANL